MNKALGGPTLAAADWLDQRIQKPDSGLTAVPIYQCLIPSQRLSFAVGRSALGLGSVSNVHLGGFCCDKAADEEVFLNDTYPRKGLFDTEDRTLFCANVGREYHLSVSLPPTYKLSQQAYPVIYLLDGDLVFGMVPGLTTVSHWFVGTPEVVVVGINYDMESYDEWATQRMFDFKVPEMNDPEAAVGCYGDRFLDALIQEIIPFIEANYRVVSSDRCLYGYSASGFFALYVLLHQPDIFQKYLAGSAVLELAYPYFITRDERLSAREATQPIHLYLSVGELETEMIQPFHDLIAWFESRNYPWLTLTTEIYPGELHGAEGVALTYLHGIRKVYQTSRTPE